MALVKFDKWKLLSGEIKPEKVVPIIFQPYDINAKGATVIDLNQTNINDKKKLVSLYTAKTSQLKFNQVIDTSFQDFPIQENNNAIELIQSRLNALLAEKNSLLSERDVNRDKIAELNAIIEDLRKQLQQAISEFSNFKPGSLPPEQINEIPDQIPLNAKLYSDRMGRPNDPGYPLIQNQLLSKNRKAKLIIQGDGNVIITKGDYTGKGTPKGPEDVVVTFGWNNGASSPNYLALARRNEGLKSVALVVGGLKPTPKDHWRTPDFEKVSNKARLVLDDIGILTIFDNERLIWSTFDLDPTDKIYDVARLEAERDAANRAAAAAAAAAAEAERKRLEDEERARREEEERRRNSGIRGVINRTGAAIGNAAQAVGGAVGGAVRAVGSAVSSAASAVGRGIRKLFSDRRLKTDIQLIGQSPSGINIYSFRFINDTSKLYQGVLADELIGTEFESAVSQDESGFLIVDYGMLDVEFKEISESTAALRIRGGSGQLSGNSGNARIKGGSGQLSGNSGNAKIRGGSGQLSGNSGNARTIVKSKSNIRNN
jgi:hypothetical protein